MLCVFFSSDFWFLFLVLRLFIFPMAHVAANCCVFVKYLKFYFIFKCFTQLIVFFFVFFLDFAGLQILERFSFGWLELAKNQFIWFSKGHRSEFFFNPLNWNIHYISFRLSLGSSYWKYIPTMWWIFKISFVTWLSIGWRRVHQVSVHIHTDNGNSVFPFLLPPDGVGARVHST